MSTPTRWRETTFPHPPGRKPVLGDLRRLREPKPLQVVTRRVRGLGPVVEFKAFGNRVVLVTGAEVATDICDEKRFEKTLPPAVEALRVVAGDGLFTARTDEPNWRLAHELLMPAFSRPAMQRYHATMLQAVRDLFGLWDAAAASGRPVDVSSDLTRLTLETIARCAFSTDLGSFDRSDQHPFVRAMVRGLRAGQRRAGFASLPLIGTALNRHYDRLDAPAEAYQQRMVDDLITTRRTAGDIDDRDLLGIMLGTPHPETGQPLSDENVRFQIITFLTAGHETTSGTLSFALHHLARNPEVRTRAYAEVDSVLGPDPGAEPSFEQVPKFRYLRRVIDETLRLWPTAPAFARGPRGGSQVLAGRWRMEPGDSAIVLLPALHRDPEVWADPERFDPDRFTSAAVHARPPHTYKPFGTGERACIGRQFALHEAVLALALILRRYDLADDPAYALDVTERLTLMPRGFLLRLSRR